MRELLLIIFAAGIIYFVIKKVQPHGFIFQLKKEESKPKDKVEEKPKENLLEEGQNLYNKGELEASEKKFLEFIKNDPQNAKPYHFLGMIYLRQKIYDGAIEALEQAVKLDPLDDVSFNNLGLCYMNIDNQEEAIKNLEKSVSLNDSIAHRYLNLALAYQKVSNLEKAAIALENAVKIHPSVENLTLLSKNYLKMGNKKLAAGALERLLEHDSENSWAKRQITGLED